MAALPMIFLAASTAMSAVGAIAQGRQANAAAQSEAQALDYNAKVGRARAEQANATAGLQEDLQRQKARAAIGDQVASSASAGAGLNSDLLRQSIFNSESDALAIRYDGNLKAAGLNDQAALDSVSASNARQRGKAAVTGSYINAAGSLLNGGNSYYQGKKAGIY